MDGMNRHLIGLAPMTKESEVVDNIMNESATAFNTTLSNIKSSSRKRWDSVYPRQCAMYLIKKKYPKMTLEEIAKNFEGWRTRKSKNHATVIHALKSVDNLLHYKWGDDEFIDDVLRFQTREEVVGVVRKLESITGEVPLNVYN